MMPTKTLELQNLYRQQNAYSPQKAGDSYNQPSLLQWPENNYFKPIEADARLIDKSLFYASQPKDTTLADQIFGSQKYLQFIDLKHNVNLLSERCRLHKQHLDEIQQRHIEIQGRKFGAEINNYPDRSKRLSNLEGQLLQLEQQRRDEELSFWKDTMELRNGLFEKAGLYRASRQRYSLFSGIENSYGSYRQS